jgi:hypothetical protein
MTLLTHRDEGPEFRYAGQPTHVLAGHGGLPPGFGVALSPDTPPDPERMRDIYARHASRLLP